MQFTLLCSNFWVSDLRLQDMPNYGYDSDGPAYTARRVPAGHWQAIANDTDVILGSYTDEDGKGMLHAMKRCQEDWEKQKVRRPAMDDMVGDLASGLLDW